jgi:hypothetical protein
MRRVHCRFTEWTGSDGDLIRVTMVEVPGIPIEASIPCPICSADLKGTPINDCCPRCGQSIAEALHLDAFDPNTSTIGVDLACVGCGYDLRTLRIDAVCPECSRPVFQSLVIDDLSFADPEWLWALDRGTKVILRTMMGAVALLFCPLSCLSLLLGGTGGVRLFARGSKLAWVLACAFLVGMAALAVGVWLTTTPDSHARERSMPLARKAGRVAMCIAVADGTLLSVHLSGLLTWKPAVVHVLGLIMVAAITLVAVGVMACLQRAAERAGSGRLAGRTANLIQLTVIAAVLVSTEILIRMGSSVAGLPSNAHVLLSCLTLVLLLFWFPATFTALFVYRGVIGGALWKAQFRARMRAHRYADAHRPSSLPPYDLDGGQR